MSIYSLVPFLSESDVDLPSSFKPDLKSRDQLIHALTTEKFAIVLKRVQEEGSHFESELLYQLIRPKLFCRNTTKEEVENHLVTKEYRELADNYIEAMEAEFYSTRQTLYQRILAVEAERLNCDISEVRPMVPVHPLNDNETESKLCQLPDDVFVNILTRLESIEVFRATLVCKKWRQFVNKNSAAFKRIEYAPTTHLITFTEWMNPSSEVSIRDCLIRFDSFAWSLVKWCCETFQSFETLILKGLQPHYHQVIFLLIESHNLKNLQFTLKCIRSVCKVDSQLSNLEMLIVNNSLHHSSSSFVRRAFTNSTRLRGFRGQLTSRLIIDIDAKNPMAFSCLIALELIVVPSGVLETLSRIDQLKLRYLKLGDTSDMQDFYISSMQFKRRDIDAFYNLLSRLGQLKVLVAIFPMGLDCNSIQVLTMLRLDLKQACIRLDRLSSQNQRDNEMGIRDHADPRTTIASFANMLVKQDSSVDLSAFEFIVNTEVSRSVLLAANTGLSIYSAREKKSLYYDTLSLSHPVMRKQLGINF